MINLKDKLGINTQLIKAELSCVNCCLDHTVEYSETNVENYELNRVNQTSTVLKDYCCEQCKCNAFNILLFYTIEVD